MKVPYFLWDYSLNTNQVKKILSSADETKKIWLVGRILEHAHFRDVFKYLDLAQIIDLFPKLRLRPASKLYWRRALTAWGHHV